VAVVPVSPEAAAAVQRALTALAGGDRRAFDAVFEGLWPIMRAFCLRQLNQPAEAEDAAQRALLKLFEQAANFDPTRSAVAWGLTLAAWECRTARRRWSRSRTTGAEVLGGVPDAQPGPEQHAQQAQVVARVEAALAELSPLDRETVLATLNDEAPEVPGATFRKRRQRAMSRLRALLGGRDD
jgi:RNA polymerase sigma-70 factor (ECF subfamily)